MNFSEKMKENVMSKLKEYFNGYCFKDSVTLYCPHSVMCYLKQTKGKTKIEVPNNDWTGTGRVSALTDKLNASVKAELTEALETLLCPPYHLRLPISELKESQAASYGNFTDVTSALRILYHYGYLTYNFEESEMQIPNLELHCSLSYHFRQLVGYNISTGEMFKHLIKGDDDKFQASLRRSLGCLSYFDFKEKFYHAFVLGLIRMELNKAYFISSELITGEGRSDVTAYSAKTDGIGLIIVELKHASNEKEMKELANDALEQINLKGYGKELLENHPSLRYVFVGKT
eukprot:TRINITY_DN1366_c0_g2_i1.p1 TRINITY_DN1366_c0_g2~~TRINITY_DN1366_c0_g2_i1.p1  ORF type:complete len:288 (-),score=16.19 TRINITY_DN1366_c0_g2_i1:123-986(-)